MKSVLVTGTSTGIGRAVVADLAGHGFHVWATVRTEADAEALRTAYPDGVSVLRVDLTDADSIKAAGETVCAAGPLHALVNNAGVALPGPLEHMPVDLFRRQVEVNLVAQLAMTQAVMPALRAARDGGGDARIVMIGSIGGRVAGPMLGAYHASKFGLVGLTDSLRAELAPSGIPVVLLEPGAVATPIWGRGRTAADEMTDGLSDQAKQRYARQFASVRADAARAERRGLPAERVATVVRTAVTASRPRARYLVGPDAHIGALLGRLSFRLARRLTAARG